MASSVEDFTKRLARNKKITFVFTEDFFGIEGRSGINTSRFCDLRNTIKHVGHRRGVKSPALEESDAMFDVEVIIIRSNNTCFATSFRELANGPFSSEAEIAGYGQHMVDAQKAKFQVEAFFAEKIECVMTITQMLNERKNRQIVLVAEKHSDLKRPSLEPVRKLRHRLCTVLVNPNKGPVVDCQVMTLYQEGNSNTLVSLLNHFCVKY